MWEWARCEPEEYQVGCVSGVARPVTRLLHTKHVQSAVSNGPVSWQ